MFLCMSHRIFFETSALGFQFVSKRRINWCIAEWSSPRTFAKNRGILTTRKMPDSQNNHVLRNFNLAKNCTGDLAGVNISRVRHETSFHSLLILMCGLFGKLSNAVGEFLRVGRIKLAGNSGEAKHGRSAKSDGLGSLAFYL